MSFSIQIVYESPYLSLSNFQWRKENLLNRSHFLQVQKIFKPLYQILKATLVKILMIDLFESIRPFLLRFFIIQKPFHNILNFMKWLKLTQVTYWYLSISQLILIVKDFCFTPYLLICQLFLQGLLWMVPKDQPLCYSMKHEF